MQKQRNHSLGFVDMLFQISGDYLLYVSIFYIILIPIQFYYGFRISKHYLRVKKEKGEAAPYLLATSLFFLCLAMGRVVFAVFDFILTNFMEANYPSNAWVWKIAVGVTTIGMAFFAFQLEKKPLQNKTKGIMTIVIIGFVVLTVANPVTDLPSFNLGSYFLLGATLFIVITPFIYFWLATKMPGMKGIGIAIGIGMILYFAGEGIVANPVVTFLQGLGYDRGVPYLAAEILKIAGMILVGTAFVKEMK